MSKPWLIIAGLLALAAAMVALWQSNQTLLAVVRAEHPPRPLASRPALAPSAAARTPSAATPTAEPGTVAAAPATAPARASTPPPARPAPVADPIVISDNRTWTFSAGQLAGAEEGLLHFAGGIGLAYQDGTWLTGERADIAFASGAQEASTITIPDQATIHFGEDTMNIAGDCVIQSTNGQVTSITADAITVTRAVTNDVPPVADAAAAP